MLNSGSVLRRTMLAGAALAALGFGLHPSLEANAENGKRICVSWRHFQEERWRIDEAGIKSVLGPAGYTYVSADAQGDPQKQMTDVDSLLASKCDAAIILAQDFERESCLRSRRRKRPMSPSSPMMCRSTPPT